MVACLGDSAEASVTNDSPFVNWLFQQKHRPDNIGLLAREAVKDRTFPRSATRLFLFLHYYSSEPENRRLIKAAHATWRRSA
jgi:hypothetical protein